MTEPASGHAYALSMVLRVEQGGPAHLHDAEFTIGVDGSLWISSWEHLAEWRDHHGPYGQQAGLLTLLFAARGALREVGPEERDRIAQEAWLKHPMRLDGSFLIPVRDA